MHGEYSFHTYAAGYAPHSEVGCRPSTVLESYDNALESLNSLPVALSNAKINPDSISSGELGNLGIRRLLYKLGGVHSFTQ